jgi:hypothetical integral membrane protein (TIGR02206 family)
MWDYILTYRTELPAGLGWEHFGVVRLSYLIGFALATVAMVIFYRRTNDARRRKIRIAYACIVVTLEVIKQIIRLVTGVYEPGLIPLHLCGMSIVFIAIHTFFPNRTTAELLYSLSLPGAVAALLFSDWNMYPLANFFCQQSFFIHFFEFSYPILLMSSGELRPRFTQLWRCVLYLLIVVPLVYFFNHAMNTNFFFLNEAAPGSPLSFLQSTLGNPGYVFGFVGLVFVVWLVMYLPWIMKTWWEKSHSPAPAPPRAARSR